MKNKKRMISFALAGILFLSNGGMNYQLLASEGIITNMETSVKQNESNGQSDKKLMVSNIPDKKELKDLSEEKQALINMAVTLAKESGKQAAEYLNQLQDSELLEIGIKVVLDFYYSAEILNESFVKEFAEDLTVNIEKEIATYTEARKERDNKDKLNYVAGELLVIFDKDTTKEEIKKITEYISDSYEIILDNDFVMDESLSDSRKDRLEALKNYKGNIVVVVNLDLDQTVQGAKEEFEAYECVVKTGKNEHTSVAGTVGLDDCMVYAKAPTNVKAVKTAAKAAKITWKKSNSADGYEIYLKKGKEKYKRVKIINSAKTTSYKIQNISNKNTYKIKIRSFIKTNGNKSYSSYTKAITLNMSKAVFPESVIIGKNIKIKVGETRKLPIKCPLDDNEKSLLKSVKCTIKNKKIASVKDCKIIDKLTGKKSGTTTITVKVTLKSGATKTFTRKIEVTD